MTIAVALNAMDDLVWDSYRFCSNSTRWRFAVLITAAVVAPISLVVKAPNGATRGALVVGTTPVVLFALVIHRMYLMERSLESALRRPTRPQSEFLHVAFQDTLTGLPNRASLDRRLDSCYKSPGEGGIAILFLGLDNPKDVNDGFGHASGDQLLITVAGRLRGCVRGTDVVTRLGGDEFLVLLDVKHQSALEVGIATAQRILDALRELVEFAGERLPITASIGIARPGNATRPRDELLGAADRVMYEARRSGKNCYGNAYPKLPGIGAERLGSAGLKTPHVLALASEYYLG
jgi:diguanylate cyclase (GGDEF)-like protein